MFVDAVEFGRLAVGRKDWTYVAGEVFMIVIEVARSVQEIQSLPQS